MMFQMRVGDLLIQSGKIIGFFKILRTDFSFEFYRAISIITMNDNQPGTTPASSSCSMVE